MLLCGRIIKDSHLKNKVEGTRKSTAGWGLEAKVRGNGLAQVK